MKTFIPQFPRGSNVPRCPRRWKGFNAEEINVLRLGVGSRLSYAKGVIDHETAPDTVKNTYRLEVEHLTRLDEELLVADFAINKNPMRRPFIPQ